MKQFWSVAIAVLLMAGGSAGGPMADLFSTDFSTDTSRYYNYTTGGSWSWPAYGRFSYPNWVSSDPRLWSGQLVDVYAGEGKNGKQGLWCYNNPDYDIAVDANAAWALNENPVTAYPALVPAAYVNGATVSFSIKFKEEAFAYVEDWDYWPDDFHLIRIEPPWSGYELEVYLITSDPELDDWTLWVTWETWDDPQRPGEQGLTTPWYNSMSYHVGSHSVLCDGQWHDFVLRYKPSTIASWDPWPGTGGVYTNNDGWITLTDNGTTLVSGTGLNFLINGYGFSDDHATRSQANINLPVFIDFSGMAGAYDSISYGPLSQWVDIANFHDVLVNYFQFKYGQARVLVDLWTSTGDPVTARLYNVTDGVSVGESAEVSSATPVETEFAVALSMGTKAYRLQVLTGEAEVDYFAVGQLLKTAGA